MYTTARSLYNIGDISGIKEKTSFFFVFRSTCTIFAKQK